MDIDYTKIPTLPLGVVIQPGHSGIEPRIADDIDYSKIPTLPPDVEPEPGGGNVVQPSKERPESNLNK